MHGLGWGFRAVGACAWQPTNYHGHQTHIHPHHLDNSQIVIVIFAAIIVALTTSFNILTHITNLNSSFNFGRNRYKSVKPLPRVVPGVVLIRVYFKGIPNLAKLRTTLNRSALNLKRRDTHLGNSLQSFALPDAHSRLDLRKDISTT